jgi:hypothetical protein
VVEATTVNATTTLNINTNDFNICNEKLYEINSKLLLLKSNIYSFLQDDKSAVATAIQKITFFIFICFYLFLIIDKLFSFIF